MVWTSCTLHCLMPFAGVVDTIFGALIVDTTSLFHEIIQNYARKLCLACPHKRDDEWNICIPE